MTPAVRHDLLARRVHRAAAARDESAALLDALMGYVRTFFFHGRPLQETSWTDPASRLSKSRQPFRRRLHTRRVGLARDAAAQPRPAGARGFHNYFVTHLPSSSLHPDSRSSAGPHHKLPREASTPHTQGPGSSPAASPPHMPSRDLTVVRIPLRSAKHHFGTFVSRGQRPYNEDTNQAGTIDIPAFAKRAPVSLVRSRTPGLATTADSSFGDPQIFYFGVFDGHGGSECSEFLRDELHGYIEKAAELFGLGSSLRNQPPARAAPPQLAEKAERIDVKSASEVKEQLGVPGSKDGAVAERVAQVGRVESADPAPAKADAARAAELQRDLVAQYKGLIGGYFRRFKPAYFDLDPDPDPASPGPSTAVTVESVLTYAFLRADLDFVTAQARKPDPDDPRVSDFPLNNDEILGRPHLPPSGHGIGGSSRFKGGSTASVVLVSTPTPAPFWHPAAHSSIVVAHVGDTRVLLCETATGLARPLTSDHHPSSPSESRRLTRFADSMVTDSFGEERIGGLANSRAFGDVASKRVGVSAEPELTRVDLEPAQYSFAALVSDGVSGTLGDQEIVDVVKEAPTPEEGARNVVELATEVSADGDNATCLVVRLGGWERRSEGGLGSLGTKEIRDVRRREALDPRRRRAR